MSELILTDEENKSVLGKGKVSISFFIDEELVEVFSTDVGYEKGEVIRKEENVTVVEFRDENEKR